MINVTHKGILILLIVSSASGIACQKTTTAPNVSGVASLNIVNAINTSSAVIPVIGTSSPISWFNRAQSVGYGLFCEYSAVAGYDTIYVVQDNADTLNIGAKSHGMLYYNIGNLRKGGIYSLFLCGADTNSPDYLFVTDTLQYYPPTDSVTGIRFVNLVAGADPISINLEGNSNGSEVSSLLYKNITSFKQYVNNSTVIDYFFVVRDALTGDSLTQFDFNQNGGSNQGYGLTDPNNTNLLTFRNVTIAVFGNANNSNYPLNTMLIDNY
jgi:hypothetical protein